MNGLIEKEKKWPNEHSYRETLDDELEKKQQKLDKLINRIKVLI